MINIINRIVLVMMLNCLIQPAPTQDKSDTNRERDELLGPVHTVKVVSTPISASGVEVKDRSDVGSYITIYNPVGNKTEEKYFNDSGDLLKKRVWNYSISGRLSDIVEHDRDDKIIGKTVYIPNTMNNEVEAAYYNGQGKFMSKKVHVYNELGKVTKFSAYDSNGAIVNESTNNYDAKGNIIESVEWQFSDQHRKMLSRSILVYSDDDRKIEISEFDSTGSQVGKIIAGKNSDGSNIKIATYDAKGSLIDMKLVIRKLDSMGNWIIENTFQEDSKNGSTKLVEITNRTITYY